MGDGVGPGLFKLLVLPCLCHGPASPSLTPAIDALLLPPPPPPPVVLQISTLIAWPALGLAVMDTVIAMQSSKEAVMRKVDESRSRPEASDVPPNGS
ncbi:hypothetical protein TSOC_008088 [Tetrabaena socialis]|uniref:Uncharacterized protein n=1 Tax=Tetrabaena socialis TaxID=47790 RepID=A0A2J7ZZD2_9CHLO|nr:hypothetical protein TSOC_008088 [Tetrabaena socialis]|eukprot:PNH05608.1 hypothetical protein TSOC_008088 [Tetrabaena socialis]